MAETNAYPMEAMPMNRHNSLRGIKKGAMLITCIFGILFLMLYACPRLEGVLGLKTVAQYIDDRNIESNMYFYTEVEAFSEASIDMDNTRAYPPVGPQPPSP